jgi:ankyrin repeat protein
MTDRTRNSVIVLIVLGVVATWMFAVFTFEQRHDMALLGAINAGDIQAARKAFSDGAKMTMSIRRDYTLLQIAAEKGNVEMAKLLVDHGAAQTVGARNQDGQSALDIALAHGHHEMADYLRALAATNQAKDGP